KAALRVRQLTLQAVIVDADEAGGAPAELRRIRPTLKILLLSATVTPAIVRCVLDGDADGVGLKAEAPEDVVLALRNVLAGGTVMPAGWQAASRRLEPGSRPAVLSVREREVLDLVAAGMRNEQIANALTISVNTVKFHLRAIYSRFGVT